MNEIKIMWWLLPVYLKIFLIILTVITIISCLLIIKKKEK